MAFDMASGASTGATIGAGIGSIVPGVGTAIGGAAGGILGGVAGGLASRKGKSETKIQKTQRNLIDDLLRSLKGEGAYSSLFQANEADFNKSFREPAMARFRNQVAPQIQQQYLATGQQRGTGLEDTLTRAGVDMDQLLNEHYMQYQQGAQNRQAGAINSILGQGAGASNEQSYLSAAGQGAAGFLSSEGGQDAIGNVINSIRNRPQQAQGAQVPQSPNEPLTKGFEDPLWNNPLDRQRGV